MDAAEKRGVRWNPTTAEYYLDPYSHLAECRNSNPVQRGNFGEWILFRYKDIKPILRSEEFITSDLSSFFASKENLILKNTNQCPYLSKSTKKWIMYLDGLEHRQARNLLDKALEFYDIEKLIEQNIEDWISGFLIEKELDLSFSLSVFPILVFQSFYTSIQDEYNYEKLKKVSHSLAVSQDIYLGLKQYQEINLDMQFFFESISEKYDSPTLSKNSLLTVLKRINEEEQMFSKEELISLVMIFFMGGVETTKDSLTMIVMELFKDRALIDYIIEADNKQLAILIEELLRFCSPLQYTVRINQNDVEIDGETIPKNSKLFLSIASANRDPDVFEFPDQIVKDRSNNPHLTFGGGDHYCLGSKIARFELRKLLKPLAITLKAYQLDDKFEPEWQKSIFMRGLKHLFIKRKQDQ